MRISDEERREVARKLHDTKQDCDQRESPWMVEDLMRALGFGSYEDGEEHIFDRLADLSDRPTCKFKPAYGPDSKGEVSLVECTACAWTIEPWIAYEFRYCPMCGAEVVDDD